MINLRPRRRTTKVLVGLNMILAWGLVWYSTYHAMTDVAIAGVTAIAGIFGGYVGVGHMDYRSVLGNVFGGHAVVAEAEEDTYAVGFHSHHEQEAPEGEEP